MPRVDKLSLHYADADRPEAPLPPGLHALGRDGQGRPMLVVGTQAAEVEDAFAQVSIDRRGVWMHVREGVRGLHVNGRPVRRMAALRAGDAVHVDGHELMVVGLPPESRPAQRVAEGGERMLLRGIGGPNHGRCFGVRGGLRAGSAADAQLRLDDAVPPHVARLAVQDGALVVEADDPLQPVRVNGHPRGRAALHVGDQLAFGPHRFVVEAPRVAPPPSLLRTDESEALGAPSLVPSHGGGASSMRRIPWLLLAALAMAGSLALLLTYGGR